MFAIDSAAEPVVEDPCPHGIPADLCGVLCPESGVLDAEPQADGVVDLDQIPGARLALQCQSAGSVVELLTDGEVLDVVQGTEGLIRWAMGLRTRMLGVFADRHPEGSEAAPPGADASGVAPVSRWLPDEVGLTLEISRLEALGELAHARRLSRVLPETLAALESGRIDARRAEAISRATVVLPDEKARSVQASVLPTASDATLRQVRDRVRRAVARVDPDGEFRRHKKADTERRVSIRSLEDGMASLWFYGSAEQIEAAWQMGDRLARSLGADDPRTLDQRRFDVAMQVLQGRLAVTDLADVDAAVADILTTAAGTGRADQSANDPAADDPAANEAANGEAADADSERFGRAAESGVDPLGDTGPGGVGAGGDDGRDEPADAVRDDRTGGAAAAAHGGRPDHRQPTHQISSEVLVDAVVQALARRPDPHDTVHKPLIQVVVGLDTLLGGDQPAELIGHGPITATTARALAADAVYKRLVTDPLSGALLDHGRTTYTPPAALADHIRARDQICRGPRCTRRIRDLDHHQPWAAGGVTSESNLFGYCAHCHRLKDAPGWQVIAHPDGTLTWISPHGRRHTTEPYDYRPFTGQPAKPEPTGTDTIDNEPPPF